MKYLILILALLPTIVWSQCNSTDNLTTTYNNNNGQNGVMFDLVVGGTNAILLNCIETNWSTNGNINYEVYIKAGSCMGFATDPTAWTLQSGGTVVSAGVGNPTLITLDSSIYVDCGGQLSLYITSTNLFTIMGYTNGTAFGSVYSADANISILEGYGKQYPFSNTYTPRVFNGTLRYDVALCNSLPVELTYFDGECGSLTWQTASENNNDYFLIAESLDGIVWRNIESLEGQGTTTETTDYAIDISGSNTIYYRLTQVDFDGAKEVFPIISVDCNVNTKEVSGYYDLMGRSVNQENVRGYYLVLFSDGSTERKYK